MIDAGVDFDRKLSQTRTFLRSRLRSHSLENTNIILFFSVSDKKGRARVVEASGKSLESVWQKGLARLRPVMKARKLKGRWLRVDWVDHAETLTWRELNVRLAETKRNYFRYGIALDKEFAVAFTEQELNANAMLYGGNTIRHAAVNRSNFSRYFEIKYPGLTIKPFEGDDEVVVFSTRGVFCDENGILFELNGAGREGGRRHTEQLNSDDVLSLIRNSSDYLARQVNEDGSFVYGYHPCFGRRIDTYNALRHAATTYAMNEAWEVTRDTALKDAIERSLNYIAGTLARNLMLPSGSEAAFIVDVGDEIKLGANAAAILAITKHCQLTGTRTWLPLAEKLARGIQFMQDQEKGSFTHVFNYPDLSAKDQFRIIYYDGEAAFAMLRLYEITGDPSLLESTEKAFSHFIASDHWQYHDHWLSYSANELTRYRPEERYFRFGIRNVATYLDYVIERITTYPTLLELMMAAENMITRIRDMAEYRHLLDDVDLDKFYRALHIRANYLLNGYFWPELAMYFQKPDEIVDSFFIRHHAFRVRIDDVEHYLSGFVAYRKYLLRKQASLSADAGDQHSSEPSISGPKTCLAVAAGGQS